MFKVIKLKTIIVVVVLVIISVFLGVEIVNTVSIEAIPKTEHVIVIDAGHGGLDVK